MSDFDGTLNKSLDDFMESYKITDTEKIYSNGTEFVPIFRVKQWFEYNNQGKEIERLKEINKELGRDYSRANNGYLKLHSIIKEVREYINFLKEHYEELRTNPIEDSYFINDMLRQMFIQSIENYLVGIEDILEKEDNNG